MKESGIFSNSNRRGRKHETGPLDSLHHGHGPGGIVDAGVLRVAVGIRRDQVGKNKGESMTFDFSALSGWMADRERLEKEHGEALARLETMRSILTNSTLRGPLWREYGTIAG